MHAFTKILVTVAFSTILVGAPQLFPNGHSFGYDTALAKKGGNGNNGNGNGNNGNGNGNGGSANGGNGGAASGGAVASATGSGKSKAKTQLTSQMGALNAAHASASAFAHANPKSRVGRIKEAVLQSAAADDAQQAATAVAQAAIDASPEVALARQAVTDANAALTTALADPTADAVTIDGLKQAIADAEDGLAEAETAAVAADPTATAAQAAAVEAQAAADAAWKDAANKTPVTDDVKAATRALVEGKIDLTAEPVTAEP